MKLKWKQISSDFSWVLTLLVVLVGVGVAYLLIMKLFGIVGWTIATIAYLLWLYGEHFKKCLSRWVDWCKK